MDVFENPERAINVSRTGGPPDLKLLKTPAQKKRAAAAAKKKQEEELAEQNEYPDDQYGPPSFEDDQNGDVFEDQQQPSYTQPSYTQPGYTNPPYQQPPVQQPPVQQPYSPPPPPAPQYQQSHPEYPPCYNEIQALSKIGDKYKEYLKYHRELLKYEEVLLQRSVELEEKKTERKPPAVVKTMADDRVVKEGDEKKAKNMRIMFLMGGVILMMGCVYIVSGIMGDAPMTAIAMIVAGLGGGLIVRGIR